VVLFGNGVRALARAEGDPGNGHAFTDRPLKGKRAVTDSKSQDVVTTSPDGNQESLLLRERVRALEPDEAGPRDCAALHEPSSAPLEEDHLFSAA
jgi:hypothetical protein